MKFLRAFYFFSTVLIASSSAICSDNISQEKTLLKNRTKLAGWIVVGGISNTALFRCTQKLATEFKSLRKAIVDPRGRRLCGKSIVSAAILAICFDQASIIYKNIGSSKD